MPENASPSGGSLPALRQKRNNSTAKALIRNVAADLRPGATYELDLIFNGNPKRVLGARFTAAQGKAQRPFLSFNDHSGDTPIVDAFTDAPSPTCAALGVALSKWPGYHRDNNSHDNASGAVIDPGGEFIVRVYTLYDTSEDGDGLTVTLYSCDKTSTGFGNRVAIGTYPLQHWAGAGSSTSLPNSAPPYFRATKNLKSAGGTGNALNPGSYYSVGVRSGYWQSSDEHFANFQVTPN